MFKIVARVGAGISGVATALLRSADGRYYILSCQHVIAATSKTPNLEGIPNLDIEGPGYNFPLTRGNKPVIASAAQHAHFPHAAGLRAIDASLALVKNDFENHIIEKHKSIGPFELLHDPTKLDEEPGFFNREVKIMTSRGIINGRLILKFPNGYFRFTSSQGKVLVETSSFYSIETQGEATIGGDSGSPVLCEISNNYNLIGMHFWGDPQKNLSYCIPAHILIDSDIFGLDLTYIS